VGKFPWQLTELTVLVFWFFLLFTHKKMSLVNKLNQEIIIRLIIFIIIIIMIIIIIQEMLIIFYWILELIFLSQFICLLKGITKFFSIWINFFLSECVWTLI
jgi:hypothetical protein